MKHNYNLLQVFLLNIIVGLLFTEAAISQDWYNASWQYRRLVTISNPAGTALTDYQVLISLDNTFDFSKVKADGSDILLTTSDGTTMIPFWIESWNAIALEAKIWTKVPSIPTGGTTVYLYYSNPSGTSLSDGLSTFRFFDDFESWTGIPPSAWEDKAPMPTAIADQTSAVYNGKLYTFGGYGNGPGNPQNKNYEYDPATNIWTEKTPMPTARWGMAAVEFDGLIYVFGGSISSGAGNIDKNEAYDPLTNSWTTKAVIPTNLARQGVMGVKFGNKIHLFYESYHYEYDPATDAYTQKANVPIPRMWCTSAVVGSKIYLIGGHHAGSAYNDNQELDPATDSWAIKTPLPVSMWGATRDNPVINGKIYVTHGHNGTTFFTSNYVYDPMSNTWEQKGPAAHPRDGVGCGIINNKLYVVGGRDIPGGNPIGLVYNEVYDLSIDAWTPQQGSSLWTTSGTSYVFADASAQYQGNYGLIVQQETNEDVQRYVQSVAGFGDAYALDLCWNVTDDLGMGTEPRPQGYVFLTDNDINASLYFYNESNVPVVRWKTSSTNFAHLQNSTWNSWHNVTIIRNGSDSKVVFDGTQHDVSGSTGGMGRIRLGVYWATKEYFDNIRVRNWAGADPPTSVGGEQINCPDAPVVSVISQPSCTIGTGTITVTSPTGTSFTYSIGGDYQSSPVFAGLLSGSYTVTAKNSMDCISPPSSPVIINPQPLIPEQPTANVIQPICIVPTGTITVTSSLEGLSFSIDGSDYSNSTGIFTGVLPGTYYLTAPNSNNCISSPATIIVNSVTGTPDAPTVIVTQPNCNLSTGTITITAPVGEGMTYSIGGNYQSSSTFAGLLSGSYTVTAKNSVDCISPATNVTINAVPGINLNTWYDVNWPYRRLINVVNPNGTTLTDYQVLISLDNSFDFSKANADGSDIRLTTSNGKTLIPFWIESWNADALEALIWTKLPEIPSEGSTAYLYYGNPSGTNLSNGMSTFRFFDDFESWAVTPPSAWQIKLQYQLPRPIYRQQYTMVNSIRSEDMVMVQIIH